METILGFFCIFNDDNGRSTQNLWDENNSNPATGLSMFGGVVDTEDNPYGADLSSHEDFFVDPYDPTDFNLGDGGLSDDLFSGSSFDDW